MNSPQPLEAAPETLDLPPRLAAKMRNLSITDPTLFAALTSNPTTR